jgi:hypothetical protein
MEMYEDIIDNKVITQYEADEQNTSRAFFTGEEIINMLKKDSPPAAAF